MPHIKVGIGVWDLHSPYENKVLWNNIQKVIKDIKPDYFVFGGDQLDMDALNHHEEEKDNRRYMEGKRIKVMYDTFQKDILDVLEKSLPTKCEMIWLNSNHEKWGEKMVDKNPQLEGLIEVERYLELEDRGWEVVWYKQYKKIGKMYFTHGDKRGGSGGKFHANKMVNISERNVWYGHHHTSQSIVKINDFDCEPHIATCVPCACNKNPDYAKDDANSWVNGFLIFYLLPNGNFNAYTVIAIDGHFIYSGKYY